jgi:hypothetical protein
MHKSWMKLYKNMQKLLVIFLKYYSLKKEIVINGDCIPSSHRSLDYKIMMDYNLIL